VYRCTWRQEVTTQKEKKTKKIEKKKNLVQFLGGPHLNALPQADSLLSLPYIFHPSKQYRTQKVTATKFKGSSDGEFFQGYPS